MGRTSVLILLSLIFSLPAFAGLGEDESTCTRDQNGFNAPTHTVTKVGTYRLHIITLKNGTVIKEYVAGGGTIFGVTWHGGMNHPNLTNILGKHFAEYQAHANSNEMPSVKGSRYRTLKTDNIVVVMGGHMRAMAGRAWNPSLIPAGITADQIE